MLDADRHIDILEVACLVAGLSAIAFSTHALNDAIRDRSVVRARNVGGSMLFVANRHVIAGTLHLLESVAIVLVALALMQLPSPPENAYRHVVRIAFASIAVMQATRAWFDTSTRRQLIQRRSAYKPIEQERRHS